MKKKLLSTLFLFILLTGCGINSNLANEKQIPGKPNATSDNIIQNHNVNLDNNPKDMPITNSFMDGFENATMAYEKFNSYASENGMRHTPIFVEGKVVSEACITDSDMPILVLNVEQEDGNRWCVSLISETKLPNIADKYIHAFGLYGGFSDLFNLPSMSVTSFDMSQLSDARIEVESNGDYSEVWNYYYDYVEKQFSQMQDETSMVNQETLQENVATPEPSKTEATKTEPTPDITEITQPTLEQRNALKTAKNYLKLISFSYTGLIKQLEFESYNHADAVYAADNCGTDWYVQATLHAKSYLDTLPFSRESLIKQLEFDGFTHEQAVYGVEQNGYQ